MTTAIEPSADEIERVSKAIARECAGGSWWSDIALAAILAMDRRAEAVGAGEMLALIRWAHDTLIEINPSNYTHDDVCEANNAAVEVILGLAPVLGETHGKTPEWWAARFASPPAPAVAVPEVTDAMVDAALFEYSEGGCMGLSQQEKREVVWAILHTGLAAAPEPPATRSEEPLGYTTEGWISTAQRKLGPGSFWVAPSGVPTEVALYRKPPATRPEAEIRNEAIEMAAKWRRQAEAAQKNAALFQQDCALHVADKERLKAALQPFADAAKHVTGAGDYRQSYGLKTEDYRNAYGVLRSLSTAIRALKEPGDEH